MLQGSAHRPGILRQAGEPHLSAEHQPAEDLVHGLGGSFRLYRLGDDTFTNNDAEYWAKRAELEQRCRELLVRYSDKAAGKASILDDLTEEMGGSLGEFAGASIDVIGEKDDPFPSTVISLAEKKWSKPKRYGLLESLSANTRFG